MDAQQILNADLDDIVFEGRNKNYGAYFLRKNYGRNLLIALFISLGLYIFGFGAPYILTLLKPPAAPPAKKNITYTELSQPPPIDKTQPPPPPPDLPPPPPKTVKFTPPVIKPDEEVKPEDVPPPQEELQHVDIAAEPADPNANYSFNEPAPPVEEAKPQVFTFVEQMPAFPGGEAEMMKFIYKNIRYPPAARENGIDGKVVLQFVVDESGSISDIQVLRDIGGGCAEEAIRVVKLMPPWKPGKQNGNAVKVYFKLPVTFKLGAE